MHSYICLGKYIKRSAGYRDAPNAKKCHSDDAAPSSLPVDFDYPRGDKEEKGDASGKDVTGKIKRSPDGNAEV